MTLRLTLILSAVFLFVAFAVGALFTTRACFMAGAGTGYPSLQQAINRAEPGCTIILLGGTYHENVVIDKPLTVIPRAQAKPFAILGQHPVGTASAAAFIDPAAPSTLQAASADRAVIEIRASHVRIDGLRIEGGRIGIQATDVRDVQLTNLTVSRSQEVGIELTGVQESVLRGSTITHAKVGVQLSNSHQIDVRANVLRRNGHGIRLENANANVLRDNEIAHSESAGLRLTASDRNEIHRNALVNNTAGVVLQDSSHNALAANRLDRNGTPLRVWGSGTSHFVHRIASDNTINGRPVHYLVDAEGVTISSADNAGYLALVRSRNVIVRGVTLPEGSQGVLMISTQGSTIENVTIPASEQGLYLQDAADNALIGNRVERTTDDGITLIRSSGNRLATNVVRANGGHGVLIDRSDANTLVANEIRDNQESGVQLSASRGARLSDNRLIGNWVGVYLDGGGEHRLIDNAISKSQFAVYVQGTRANRFQSNRLTENRHASNRPALLDAQAEAAGDSDDSETSPSGD